MTRSIKKEEFRIYAEERLENLGFPKSVLDRYDEPHRFYHTLDHVFEVTQYLLDRDNLTDELFLVSIYHDAVYDPKSSSNELDSSNLFLEHAKVSKLAPLAVESVARAIQDTKYEVHSGRSYIHNSTTLSDQFIDADLSIFEKDNGALLEYEKKIFKEFQFVDLSVYRDARVKVLEAFNDKGNLDFLISYVKTFKPSIAVFPGSFNPFHKGHLNILNKAEAIFDKVILASGVNPDKGERTWDIPKSVQNRQLERYSGLLTDFLQTLDYEVVVVRGLRNSTDFQYEQNQYRYLQELMPSIRIVNIFCDKEYEHISSSGIRTLEKYGRHLEYLVD